MADEQRMIGGKEEPIEAKSSPVGQVTLSGDPHALRRVLAATGAAAYVAALEAEVEESLEELVSAGQEAGYGVFLDTLHLVYGGRLSSRDLLAISHGFKGTSHSAPAIEAMVEVLGIRGAVDQAPLMVGLQLDTDEIALIPPERLISLLEAPLLARGLNMDEAKLLFGKDYVPCEDVEHDLIRHTWTYARRGMSMDPELELRFENDLLVGWKDHRGKGRAIIGGDPRMETEAEIPHQIGGFHLAATATCVALLEAGGALDTDIDTFIDDATEEIRASSVSWPGPELATLTAIGERTVQDRIRTDEAPDRLDHYADRFASYDPDADLVPREAFVNAALRVLTRVGGLEKISSVNPVIYWLALTLLVVSSLGYLVFRSQLKAADAWPEIPIEDPRSAPSAPATPQPSADPNP
jgi:hypothetical protein